MLGKHFGPYRESNPGAESDIVIDFILLIQKKKKRSVGTQNNLRSEELHLLGYNAV
jgi:hypothetical protein